MTTILTLRQEQVIGLVAQGKTDKEISGILGISDKTVEFHIGKILSALKAKSRSHAVAIRFIPKNKLSH